MLIEDGSDPSARLPFAGNGGWASLGLVLLRILLRGSDAEDLLALCAASRCSRRGRWSTERRIFTGGGLRIDGECRPASALQTVSALAALMPGLLCADKVERGSCRNGAPIIAFSWPLGPG